MRWGVPLLAALVVFVGVLLSTPPGFGSLADVLLGAARGPNADAAAYALGAASTLALVCLCAVAGLYGVIELLRRRR